MAALKLTACMKVVAKMGEMDQEALLERLDRYTADGVPKDRAQVMAAADSLAELQDERREFMAMLRQQHPDLFVVSNAIPEDQDVNPDQPDLTIEELRSYISESNSPRIEGYMPPDWDYVAEQARRLGLDDLAEYASSSSNMRPGVDTALDLINPDRPDIKRSTGRSEQEIAAAKADGWKIMDNDLPSREAAERIIKLRTKGNSVVKPMASWQDAEVRVVESDNPGFWAIEARRPDAKRSTRRNDMGFYSALANGIEDMQTKSAPAGAWKAQIKGLVNKGAVKQDEVTWSGIEDWLDLQDGKVTKDAIAEYLKQGGVQVEEVVLGNPNMTERQRLAIEYDRAIAASDAAGGAMNPAYIESLDPDQRKPEEQALLDAWNRVNENPYEDAVQPFGGPKYAQYTLPGGENYREVLLTLPVKKEKWVMRQVADGRWEVLLDDGSRSLGFFKTEGSAGSELDYVNRTASESPKGVYKSNHWDQKNVLAHIRVNDRTDADGKRVLFVEEIQSDWGQEGKKKGFSKPILTQEERDNLQIKLNQLTIQRTRMAKADREAGLEQISPETEEVSNQIAEIHRQLREDAAADAGAPLAPFVTKTDGWLNLALKRVIAMAVDGGYDAVAFVNGDQSADRYDLSKQIESVTAQKWSDGGFKISAVGKGGDDLVDQFAKSADELEGIVGKELAQKIVDATSGDQRKVSFNGLDLKVGGEGMKAFYDKIVPNAIKALLKKVGGGQMESVSLMDASEGWKITPPDENVYGKWMVKSSDYNSKGLTFDTEEEAKAALIEKAGAMQQPGFTITDAMREKVTTEGLPLFSRKRDVTETPEFQAWFSGSQVVDENGLPKVQYHSTNSTDNFGVFRTDRELGAHFGTERQANERGGGFVYPVYLSIKNPLRLEDKGDFHAGNVLLQLRRMGMITRQQAADMSSDVRPIQAIIESAGYDGVVYLNRNEIPGVFGEDGVSGDDLSEMTDQEVIEMFGDDAQDSWIAFRPEQIKSAIGNNGDFDPANPDIRRSTGRTSTGAAWDSPSASKFDDLVYKFQDKNIETKRVVEAIKDASGAIADDLNVYLQEELYHGRAAKRTEDFVNMELNPLVEQLAKDGLKLEDLEEFLHARHAPEANEVIARRNPGVAGLQDGGSGMKTADALNYMATLPPDLKQKLETAAAKVDAIIGKTRQLYVDYELESQDTVDGWGRVFQHYIPLQREDKDGKPGLGQGFSVKGKETKGRTGSARKVVDILANIAMQRERAIVRGEKNRVSQALLGLAAANPNEGFWKVDEVPTEKVYNPDTGLVEDRIDPMFKSRENAVVSKVKGADGKVKEHAVIFNEEDERALRMAKALKNLDADKLEGMLGVSAQITRYFASVNTQYNPVFGVVNLVRDVQGAILNLSSTQLAGDEAKIAKNTMSALRGIYSDARAARKGNNPSSAWAKLWDEFQEVGGQTGYRDLFKTSADRADAIKKTLDPDAWADTKLGKIFTANGALKVPMAQAKRGAGWIFDWLSDYNLAMENGVRLAAYKAGLERGLSKEQAASAAKNLTVNFNRKGQVSQQAGAMYAFFNASLQGTARIFQTIFEMEPGKPKTIRLSPMGKKIVYGGMLLGSIQAMALAAAGFNDEDPPQFARERGLIIPLMNGKYLTIPMPLGFHVIPNIGRITTEFALSGFRDPHERALQLVSLFADTFNPIGNAGLSMQTLAPTALDPLVALTENRDWTGKPIARESSNPAVPGHALARDTATSLSKFLSEAINTASGGNKYVAGIFSPTPDQIDYLIGQVTGGVGRELSKVEQSSLAVARGEDLPTFKMPLVGRFVGDAKQQASEGTAFYANTERINKLETEIKGLQKDGKYAEAAELRRTNSDAYLIAVANQAERQIQKLRSEKRELIKNNAPREQVRAIEERITAVMARLNRAAERLKEQQGN